MKRPSFSCAIYDGLVKAFHDDKSPLYQQITLLFQYMENDLFGSPSTGRAQIIAGLR